MRFGCWNDRIGGWCFHVAVNGGFSVNITDNPVFSIVTFAGDWLDGVVLTEKTWRPEAVWMLVVANFTTLLFGMLLASGLTHWLHGWERSDLELLSAVCAAGGFQGATLVLVAVMLRQCAMTWDEAFGVFGNVKRAVANALAWAPGIVIVALLLGYGANLVLTLLGGEPEPQAAVQILQRTDSLLHRCVLGFLAVVLAPVSEEILFRGVVYPTIKQLGLPHLALWGTSIIFAMTHANLMAFVPLVFVAVMLTWLYEKTGNLLAPIVAHAVFNLMNFVVLIFEKDIEQWMQS